VEEMETLSLQYSLLPSYNILRDACSMRVDHCFLQVPRQRGTSSATVQSPKSYAQAPYASCFKVHDSPSLPRYGFAVSQCGLLGL
jgi:hypothetical protein